MAHRYRRLDKPGRKAYRGEVKMTIDGETVRRVSGVFYRKKDAEDWEAEQRKELRKLKREGPSAEPQEYTFFDAANAYLDYAEQRFHRTTYLNKRKILREVQNLLMDKMGTSEVPLSQVHPKLFLDFVMSLDTASKGNRARKELHAFFKYCMDWELYLGDKNPISMIEKVDEERKAQRVPTEEEMARLLAAANRHDRNMIVAFCVTGARKSELLRMTWQDVNFEKGFITLWNRKGRGGWKERQAPMDAVLRRVLEEQWKTRLPHSNYVFQNRDRRHSRYGDRYTARRRFLAGLCKRAGIPRMGFHALRRFYGSIMIDKYKTALPTLQKLLGHDRLTTTEKYVYNITSDQKEAVANIGETIEELLKGKSDEVHREDQK
jgi:integrase